MSVISLPNPYQKGTVIHQNFQNSLAYFDKLSDPELEKALSINEINAKNNSVFNFNQLDYYERECRAIRIVMEDREI